MGSMIPDRAFLTVSLSGPRRRARTDMAFELSMAALFLESSGAALHLLLGKVPFSPWIRMASFDREELHPIILLFGLDALVH
mmetsp:Transcript_8596/g.11872  ORF Transcript_8596/g.11872 Transcript_8596/m.11872 type:complete len:82 (+) Transcript_8596:1161-1406(+)